MAGAAGFEPATLGFGDRCSNQAELRSCDIAAVGVVHLGVGRPSVRWEILRVP
jgi:hypothetical protein